MEIKQRRNSNRIGYVFGEAELQYSIQDTSGSRSFTVGYADISRDRQTMEERNQWLGNVGLLWLALGAVLTVVSAFSDKGVVPSLWLFVGAGCYAVYRLRTTRFTIVPSEKGNLLVIHGEDGTRILHEIETRRAAWFRSEYDYLPEGDTVDEHRARIKWLHRQGALTDEELNLRLSAIDAADPAKLESAEVMPAALLN